MARVGRDGSGAGGNPLRPGEVTQLLLAWTNGETDALERLLPIIHRELRVVARRQLRSERIDHTLQPTALVNELYLRLVDQRRASWNDRLHFFAAAARMMRRILVDHARARVAAKRGANAERVSLVEAADVQIESAVDVLAVDRALERLAELDAEQAHIVELRFFSGLSVDETAAVLGRSPRTIKRQWRIAKAWLFQQLSRSPVATGRV